MSILNALGPRQHLGDADFADLWSRQLTAGADAAVQDPHLRECPPCRARYTSVIDWFDGARSEAIAESDERFPVERLAAQQAQIMRRLEALDRPARVIAFPRISQPTAVAGRGPQRWIAAAAAAGLVVGLGAGELLNFRRTVSRIESIGRTAPVAGSGPSARTVVQPVSLETDDAFLDDSAPAIMFPRVEALQALDSITPLLRDDDQPR